MAGKLKPVIRKAKTGLQLMLPSIVIDFLKKYAEVPSKLIEETLDEAPYLYWLEYRKATKDIAAKHVSKMYSYWPDAHRKRFVGYFTVELVGKLQELNNPGVFVERVLVKIHGKHYFKEINVTKKRDKKKK